MTDSLEAAMLRQRLAGYETQVHNIRSTVSNLLERIKIAAQEEDYDAIIEEIDQTGLLEEKE